MAKLKAAKPAKGKITKKLKKVSKDVTTSDSLVTVTNKSHQDEHLTGIELTEGQVSKANPHHDNAAVNPDLTNDKLAQPKNAKGILKQKGIKTSVSTHKVKDNNHETEEVKTNDSKHASLLKAIQSLDGKKAPITQRNEAALRTSEFHNRDTKKVHFGQLLQSLGTSTSQDVKKYIKQQDGSRKLPEPLERIHVTKAERSVQYKETAAEVEKWQTIVEDNRVVPQLQFPLERSKISVPTAKREAESHQPRTAMELEIQALLKGPGFVAEQAEQAAKPVLTKAEQQAMKAMDVETAKEELALRRKHRRMVADVASKNRRQGKIKSRSYHRHLKIERKKKAFKVLEKLRADDPELWKEKAEEIERARVEERATLRHKGKSKFAKLAKRYGKFNEKIKDSLDEMRAKGVELMTKQAEEDSESESEGEMREDVNMEEDESDDGGEETTSCLSVSASNPWMSGKLSKEAPPQPLLNTQAFDEASSEDENPVEEVTDAPTSGGSHTLVTQATTGHVTRIPTTDSSSSKERKTVRAKDSKPPVSKRLSSKRDKSQTMNVDTDVDTEQSRAEAIAAAQELEDDADELMDGVSTNRIKSRADVDRFDDQFHSMSTEQQPANQQTDDESSDEEEVVASRRQNIDPNKVISIPSTDLSGQVKPSADDSEEEDDEHRLNIAEAFADDDVVEEFSAKRKRKFEEENEAADAAAALSVLPGWGSWGGAGIVEAGKKPRKKLNRYEKEKRRAEELKKAAAQKEREAKQSKYPKGVIVNEKAIKSQPIAKYQVDPQKLGYKSSAFTAMMSHPIGKDFVPTLAHNELCKPRVVTAVGTIINPMAKDMVKEGKKQTFPENTWKTSDKIARQYELPSRPDFKKKKMARLSNQPR